MTNNEKFIESYSDLTDILYNLTGVLSNIKNTKDIYEEDLKLLSELTTNLKRMSETKILDKLELIPQNDINKEGGK